MKDAKIRMILKKVIGLVKKLNQKRLFNQRINNFCLFGESTIISVEEILASEKLTYFATCGTLLGLIRENKLLKRDYDLDYGVIIEEETDWKKIERCFLQNGYKMIRFFTLEGKTTEQTYRSNNGIEIDIFGHYFINNELCFYSYDKLSSIEYSSENEWSAYILKNGRFKGTKRIDTDVGKVTVPQNAEEYLSYNYNDDWRIPNPNFQANSGKGCSLLKNKFGYITILIGK